VREPAIEDIPDILGTGIELNEPPAIEPPASGTAALILARIIGSVGSALPNHFFCASVNGTVAGAAPVSAATEAAAFFVAIAVKFCGTPAFNALNEDVMAEKADAATPLAESTNPATPGIAGNAGSADSPGSLLASPVTAPVAPAKSVGMFPVDDDMAAAAALDIEFAAPTAPAIEPSPPVAVVARFPAKFPAAIAEDAEPIKELTGLPITVPF